MIKHIFFSGARIIFKNFDKYHFQELQANGYTRIIKSNETQVSSMIKKLSNSLWNLLGFLNKK